MQRVETGTRQADRRREAARLAALASYDILDTPPEPCSDHLARLAAEYFQADRSADQFLAEDVTTISYEQALRTHAHYHRSDPPPAPHEDTDPIAPKPPQSVRITE